MSFTNRLAIRVRGRQAPSWNTPHPSRRCAPIHLLPQQGEKEDSAAARLAAAISVTRRRSRPSRSHYSLRPRVRPVA
ncbi:MAG: hypothetical protein EOR48_25515 [Mesorhizobium sp.]|nr:MAG: hypothetical protein EOR48_25515 [Mesorhizobium sp.]